MASIDHHLLTDLLPEWLAQQHPDWSSVEVELRKVQLTSGNSAETVFVEISWVALGERQAVAGVVRGQPAELETVCGSDLASQAAMLDALGKQGGISVPQCLGYELDPTILGMPFLIMTKMPGATVPQFPNYNQQGMVVALTPDQRGELWSNGIRAFADLARLDWRKDFRFLASSQSGEPGLPQHLRHLQEWYEAIRCGRTLPMVEKGFDFVVRQLPVAAPVNVLWGDPTPANTLFLDDLRVSALLDLEMATLGPAELDLAWWLMFDDRFSRSVEVERLEGLPTREQTIAVWEESVGRAARHLELYEVLAGIRMALIAAGAFDRHVGRGNINPGNSAFSINPSTRYIARKLGLSPPDLGADYAEFQRQVAAQFATPA